MIAITERVALDRRGPVAVLIIDNPPVNAISHGVRKGLKDGIAAAAGDPDVTAIVVACAGQTFIGGVDIAEFRQPPREPGVLALLEAIEDAPKPVIAAVHGTPLGVGFELVLACHYRIAATSARFGMLEVKLGLVPAAGGSQRLPRLVGVEKALAMIAGGDVIGADEALRHGLIDEIVDGDLAAAAVAFARKIAAESRPLRRTRDVDDKIVAARNRPEIFADFRRSIARQTRGFKAPEQCIRAVETAVSLPFAESLERDHELYLELMLSAESKAQRYLLMAERQAAAIPDVPADTPAREIRKAAVIGAGTMGGGIAMNFANAGIPVTVVEVSREALDGGLAVVRRNYENTAAKGRLTAGDVERRMGLIAGTTDWNAVVDADFIIEAVFEEMAVKKEVFARLDGLARPDAVLATNTSTLDVDEIAAATRRPESVIGTHFFSPANVMRLLENVRGARSSASTIATAMAMGRRIGKIPVLVGICYGFVGNRMLHQRGTEAERLLLEGALPHQVDRVLYEFGFPMGPFAMADLAGLDVGWRIRKGRGETSAVADRLCEMGRFGQKTGAGYYRYGGDRTATPDPDVEKIIVEVSSRRGVTRRAIPDDEIRERLLYPMVNEGARILEEKVAIRASDIDVIWVYGYGWPAYRGGPMFWADFAVGLAALRDRMRDYQQKLGGDHWKPAALLNQLADRGQTFTGYVSTLNPEAIYGRRARRPQSRS
jgi:3-hydroxyacyl-CoA dehydrogenase